MSKGWPAAGAGVKQERLRRRWSLRQAAANADVSVSTWNNVEKGLRISDLSQAAISECFGWPDDAFDRLLAGLPAVKSEEQAELEETAERSYNDKIMQLPAETRAVIDTIIEAEMRKQQG